MIGQLFRCKKTILGDSYQSINPYSASKAEQIRQVLRQTMYVTLNKSYRSSIEISQFSQQIAYNPALEPIERHGEPPVIHRCSTRKQSLTTLQQLAHEFVASNHNTLGIVCKTQKHASSVFKTLEGQFNKLQLLSEQSNAFGQGIIVCTAHMAKGLEFDRVIIPEVTATQYATEMERNLLYVACTRAMHQLDLTFFAEPSPFIVPLAEHFK